MLLASIKSLYVINIQFDFIHSYCSVSFILIALQVSEVLDVYGKLITDIDVIFKIDCIEDRQQVCYSSLYLVRNDAIKNLNKLTYTQCI